MQGNKKLLFLEKIFKPLTILKAINIIAFVGLIVFSNSLFNNFVWDDKIYLLNNTDIQSFNFFGAFTPNAINEYGYFRPMYYLYFSIVYPLFQNGTFFYHLIQISIHIINSILIYIFLKKNLNKYISLFIALVFLNHPINVESVVFISNVLNPIYLMFGLISLIKLQKSKLSNKEYLLIGILLFLALITKEEGILFLFITLLYCFLFNKFHLKHLIAINTLILSIYGFIRIITGSTSFVNTNNIPIQNQNFLERLLDIPAIVFYYIKIFVFPKDMVIYQLWVVKKINFNSFYLPLFFDSLFILFLCLGGIYLFKKNRMNFILYIFFFTWFLLGILMHLQFLPLDMTVADRWFYFPIIGLLGMGGVFYQSLKISSKKIKNVVFVIAFIILVTLSLRSAIRNTNWVDEITLYEHDSKIYTNSDIEANLGTEYEINKNYNEALKHFKKALDLSPSERIYYNLGDVYQAIGDDDNALKNYKKSIDTNFYPKKIHDSIITYSYINLAIINYQRNNQAEALLFIKKAKNLNTADSYIEKIYKIILNNQPLEL